MESPEGDRIKATPSITAGSSPAVQEFPFFNYISNLSPINSVKAARYTQRFSETQFPTPPPVFRTPRLDLQQETSFLKRNEVFDAASTDVNGDCGNQLSTILLPCIQNELQSCSPSGCVDDYLTDPVEVEGCTSSNELGMQPAKLSCFSFTAPITTSTKLNDSNNRNSEDFMHMLPDEAEGDPKRSLVLFETATDQRDAEIFDGSLELTPKERADPVESNTLLFPGTQHNEQYVCQNAGVHYNGQDGSSRSPKNRQNLEDKNSSESSAPVSKGSFKESTLHQCGIRRHLQFEAALAGKGITTTKSCSSHDVTQESDNSTLPESLRGWDSLIPSDIESREASRSREATSSSQNVASGFSFCQPELVTSSEHDGSLPITGIFPSGFDLHLSSNAESALMSSDHIPSKILPGYLSSHENKLIPEGGNHLEGNSNSGLISTVAGKIHAHMDNDLHDDQAVAGASSVTSQFTDSMKLLCDSLEVTLFEQKAAPSEGMMLTTENTDRAEKLNQVSPKKKRRQHAALRVRGKRCNCKRSRCLKLYCECFAAGVYCIDSCACESCFNKPENEETVTDTRQKIESRNLLAFAPKIVNHAIGSPANVVEVGNLTTPASARHKRGCNCKKSKCLKKYCECFQANVGCSDGCRCEGCSNSFGKKTESKYRRVERWENHSHVKQLKRLQLMAVTDSTKAGTVKQFSPRWEDLPDISHLTPISHSYPGAEISSASPSIREYQNVPRPQLHRKRSFNSAVNRHWHAPLSFKPESFENNAEHGLCSDSTVHDRTKEDNVSETHEETSTPSSTSKSGVPNKKGVSPPQFQSQELRSSSSPQGLQSGRKFNLQTMPSFPPLTPYSKFKDDISQTENDFKGDPGDN